MVARCPKTVRCPISNGWSGLSARVGDLCGRQRRHPHARRPARRRVHPRRGHPGAPGTVIPHSTVLVGRPPHVLRTATDADRVRLAAPRGGQVALTVPASHLVPPGLRGAPVVPQIVIVHDHRRGAGSRAACGRGDRSTRPGTARQTRGSRAARPAARRRRAACGRSPARPAAGRPSRPAYPPPGTRGPCSPPRCTTGSQGAGAELPSRPQGPGTATTTGSRRRDAGDRASHQHTGHTRRHGVAVHGRRALAPPDVSAAIGVRPRRRRSATEPARVQPTDRGRAASRHEPAWWLSRRNRPRCRRRCRRRSRPRDRRRGHATGPSRAG